MVRRFLAAHNDRLTYHRQAEILRVLAHPARLRLLTMLASSPACVGELTEQTGFRQPYVSQHLAALRKGGLVICTRDGLTVTYYLACPQLEDFLADIRTTCTILHGSSADRPELIAVEK